MATILIADDEDNIRRHIKSVLSDEGYFVLEASNGKEALDMFYDKDIDLFILDVMMPIYRGLEVCDKIRQLSDVPVIMLTARNTEIDELMGFKKGADDYITKPFSPKILLARIEALLKRCNALDESLYEAGDISVDVRSHVVSVAGDTVRLSVREFELLRFLLANQGVSLSRNTILTEVWRSDYNGDMRTVDTHIKKLRQKLKRSGEYIQTVWGIGYKFEPIRKDD